MSVAIQMAFAAALQALAGDVPVYRSAAPTSAAAPYIVYSPPMSAGPVDRTYGGSHIEADVYLVTSAAATELEAEQLNEQIGAAYVAATSSGGLDRYPLDGAVMVRRENRAPMPAKVANQQRYLVGTYYRVTYLGGT